MSLRLAVNLDKFEAMGDLMRSRIQATREAKGNGSQKGVSQYAEIASEHFAVIRRDTGDRVVFIAHTTGLGSHKGIPFCHEVLDPGLAHFSYPLMASQLKSDLGTLKDFLSKDQNRAALYRHIGTMKRGGIIDDLTSVRAIVWAESQGLAPTVETAKAAYAAVTQNFEPSFSFRMNAVEKEVVAKRHKLA